MWEGQLCGRYQESWRGHMQKKSENQWNGCSLIVLF